MAPRLDEAQIAGQLATLAGWQRRGQTLGRAWQFADFRAAFAFLTDVAAVAEAMQHHPDWHHRYAHVEVVLTTHDAGGLTQLDFDLARAMDRAARAHGGA